MSISARPTGESISSVNELIFAAGRSGQLSADHAHIRMWFRGHAKRDWQLCPGVYRSQFGAHQEEQDRLTVEQHLNQDFRVSSAGIRAGNESDEALYFLQQHYKMPTRLLDWTNSILVALYFATLSHDADDGELFVMDAYQLAHMQGAENFIGIATSRNEMFRNAVSVIADWRSAADFPAFIIPVRPDHNDKRISLQRSCFTFHVPTRPELTRNENSTLRSFIISASAKQDIRRELTLLGVDDFTVFGDLEHLASRLTHAYLKI